MSNFSLTTFSSSGKLVQIENALVAVANGRPAIGWKANDGAVIITEKKKFTELVELSSFTKVAQITDHIGCTYAGISSDFRVVLKKARKIAVAYELKMNENIPVKELVRELADLMQEYTQSGGVRPFGVSLLVIGYTESEGPRVYQVDPSGVSTPWKATAIGREHTSCRASLERRYDTAHEVEDALHSCILTLREGFEGQMDKNNIEIGMVDKKGKFKSLTPSEINDYLTEVE